MGRPEASKAAELHLLAKKLRRRAHDMTLLSYVRLMEQAAADLDAEADMLKEDEPLRHGRYLDIRV